MKWDIQRHYTTALDREDDTVVCTQRLTGLSVQIGAVKVSIGTAVDRYKRHYERMKRIYR